MNCTPTTVLLVNEVRDLSGEMVIPLPQWLLEEHFTEMLGDGSEADLSDPIGQCVTITEAGIRIRFYANRTNAEALAQMLAEVADNEADDLLLTSERGAI